MMLHGGVPGLVEVTDDALSVTLLLFECLSKRLVSQSVQVEELSGGK